MSKSLTDKLLTQTDNLDSKSLAILAQKLGREKALLEAVFSLIKEGIVVVEKQGLIAYANDAALALLGLQANDIGKIILWKAVPELHLAFGGDFETVFSQESIGKELHITYPNPRYIRLYGVCLDGNVSDKLAFVFTDITEEKISQEAYIEQEKFSSIVMLAAGVAHELGNPLNSMNIHLQLMQRDLEKRRKDEPKWMQSVAACLEEVRRLDLIIKHFLEAVKPTHPNKNPVEVVHILRGVIEFLSQEINNLNISIEWDIETVVPIILADQNQLKQVFFNIIRNASESMDSGGSLKISIRSDESFLNIYFADTGCGMSPKDLSHVFEPYYSTKIGGTGLGMMIVHRIMRDHGGAISIESQENIGTVVKLQFPLTQKRPKMLE